MGGMAAQIPIKGNPAANEEAMARIKKDKIREALAGHDGTWVAHPALVSVAKAVFDEYMPSFNQINSSPGLEGKDVKESDLLKLRVVPKGQAITSDGLQKG
jgi:malate synthase